MKTFNKIHFPALHINPIHRDLFLLMTTSMVAAVVIVTVGVMVFGQ